MLAWEAEDKLCGVYPLPPQQAEIQLRGVQALPSRQGETRLRGVQPLPSRQTEKGVRGVHPLPSREAETQLCGVQERLFEEIGLRIVESYHKQGTNATQRTNVDRCEEAIKAFAN